MSRCSHFSPDRQWLVAIAMPYRWERWSGRYSSVIWLLSLFTAMTPSLWSSTQINVVGRAALALADAEAWTSMATSSSRCNRSGSCSRPCWTGSWGWDGLPSVQSHPETHTLNALYLTNRGQKQQPCHLNHLTSTYAGSRRGTQAYLRLPSTPVLKTCHKWERLANRYHQTPPPFGSERPPWSSRSLEPLGSSLSSTKCCREKSLRGYARHRFGIRFSYEHDLGAAIANHTHTSGCKRKSSRGQLSHTDEVTVRLL